LHIVPASILLFIIFRIIIRIKAACEYWVK
jgi:hypothetical protein